MSGLLRVIGDGKDAPDGQVPEGLAEKDLVELFRSLVLLRAFDERAVALQRQGRIGTYALYWGEEATQAGPMYALDDGDWAFPSYRQNSIGILRGVAPSVILSWWRGYGGVHGFYNTREHRVGPICVPIGTHLPHAVGVAWAAKIKGEPTASLVWFGDGATSEGDFHEAMNFSGVFKTATVFFCVNNQWAISTPYSRQTATPTIVEKAAAYGMPGVRIDGFDPIACWQATRDALDRARSGDGPTLIEAFCYRIGAHGTADDPRLYRDEAEVEKWKALEPVGRMAAFLGRLGVLDDAGVEEIQVEARTSIAKAVTEMEDIEQPGQEILFEHVYAAGRPWTFDEGLAELRSVERQPEVKPLGPASGAQTGDVETETE
ncbi:MAG TPA: thiamine pyrophosphate-dependent dehydrogenase E1 component subunit alpha [Actinomycetota bacterium]|jgi:pyruvate dehydrogenase E1 component alpha subunit|nr:thiamine pyrophosphate-dependent dehydrogenase E1 component subunit alpha [Actinomycetota bacterium]